MNTAEVANIDMFECIVLSAEMNGADALPVCADDFASPPNRIILNRIRTLSSRGLLAVTAELRRNGELEKVGGAGRITEISGLTHDEDSLQYALDQVLEHSQARRTVKIGEQMQRRELTAEQAQEKLATLIKAKANTTKREPRIRFYTPCLLRDFVPDKDIVLIGDCHIMRGETFVIGGEPAVGKSLAATQLAVSGATQRDWFGLTVHRQFRTMIVQTENGRHRLRLEFSSLDCDEIENWIRVSEPPPFGITLTNTEFQADISAALDSFKLECVILDPWNAAARDDKIREYAETFDALRNLLPTGPDKPALGIVSHTRKPQPNEKRTGGTGLMHMLSGSYILTSVPRCIFVMTRGSHDETDDSVVFFNPKNSNGANAPRLAWHRKLSGFTPATDFDWKDFDKPPDERKIIRLDHLREVFDDGKKRLELKDAAHDLAMLVEVTDSAAYNALKADGKFSENLSRNNGMLTFHSTKIPRESR